MPSELVVGLTMREAEDECRRRGLSRRSATTPDLIHRHRGWRGRVYVMPWATEHPRFGDAIDDIQLLRGDTDAG